MSIIFLKNSRESTGLQLKGLVWNWYDIFFYSFLSAVKVAGITMTMNIFIKQNIDIINVWKPIPLKPYRDIGVNNESA